LQEALGYIRSGDFFGEMAMIDVEPRSAQATAMEHCVLGRIERSTFEHIFLIAPGPLHANLLRCVTARLREVSEHFIQEVVRTERLSLVGSMANSIIHDLKNPISVIRTCSELLRMKFQDPAATRFTTMLNRAVNNMLEMIQELLDFARGQSSFQTQIHPVAAVFADLVPRLEPLLPEKIELQIGQNCDAWIQVDLSRFSRMLLNLAKNSIEAMETGGRLVFQSECDSERVVFTVSDTGCGIPPEIRTRLFEPFVTAGKYGGTGLGMAIVKSVVDAHEGVITVESEPDKGTTMRISIPAQKPPPAQTVA
jgi:signal transduction histidine kinase